MDIRGWWFLRKFRWKHRNATKEQKVELLKERWGRFLEASKDVPETRELVNVKAAMDKVLAAMDETVTRKQR
jgi:mevalonate kinase